MCFSAVDPWVPHCKPFRDLQTFQDKKMNELYKADLYALGVVIWEVSTRKFPFKGLTRNQIMGSMGFGGARQGRFQGCSILLLSCLGRKVSGSVVLGVQPDVSA